MLRLHDDPIPHFVEPAVIIARAIQSVRAPKQVSVSECAERHRWINNPGVYTGPWKNDFAPHLVEPMDRIDDRSITGILIIGPSQTGKTEIPQNIVLRAAKYAPASILLFQPTQKLAENFAEQRVDQGLLRDSVDLAIEVGAARSDDVKLMKRFLNGTVFSMAWPTSAELSSRPMMIVIFDERDSMPDNVAGEGSPRQLGRARTTSFGRHGKVIEISSPKRPNYSGVVAGFDEGEMNRRYLPCPSCDEYFAPGFNLDGEPDLEQVKYPSAGSDEEIRTQATLHCAHCGAGMTEAERLDVLPFAVWLGAGQSIDAAGVISGDRNGSSLASYWWTGPGTSMISLGELALRHATAVRHFEATQDDADLRTVINTGFGLPYRPKAETVSPPKVHVLDERREAWSLRTVPPGVICLTAAIDVQGIRFEVAVWGWIEGQGAALVDRFAILQVEGDREIRPASRPEDWDCLLDRVFRNRYALAEDPEKNMPIMTVAIDTGGLDGVEPNARAFWHKARAAGISAGGITLVKGGKDYDGPIMRGPVWLEKTQAGTTDKEGPALFLPNTNRFKGILYTRLAREEVGPGSLHFSHDLETRYLEEITAEEKVAGKWEPRGRNETLDLYVYGLAALIRHAGERTSLEWVPEWARATRVDGGTAETGGRRRGRIRGRVGL